MPEMIREAMYYKDIGGSMLQCELCPQLCVIPAGEAGKCRSRENIDFKLWAVNYGRALGISVDPIEKKPLYHYRPGSKVLSLGPNSCNLSCRWCQNYQISQYEAKTVNLTLDELYSLVLKHSPSTMQIAFTYSEPLTWYEYILDFARKYPQVSIILVTNGFISSKPLAELLPYISAMNIDLKAMTDDFYSSYCGGKLTPVKKSIKQAFDAGIHLELTNLLIPGLNDKPSEIEEMSSFIASISPDIPLHISAYHPDYLTNQPATQIDDIVSAINLAKQKLNHVYGGNLPIDDYRNTICPGCCATLCKRTIFDCQNVIDSDGRCQHCGRIIYGQYDQ